MKDLNLTVHANVRNIVSKNDASKIVSNSSELQPGILEIHLKQGVYEQLGLIEFTTNNESERDEIGCTAYISDINDSCCLESVVSCVFAVIAQTLAVNKVSINDILIWHDFTLSNAHNLSSNIRRIGIGTTAESINAMMIQALVEARVKDALSINVFSCVEELDTLTIDLLSMDAPDKKKTKKKKKNKKK